VNKDVIWWSPEPMRVSIREYGIQFSGAVGKMLDERGCHGVRVGFNAERKVVCLAKDDAGLRLGQSGKSGKRVASKKVVRWLKSKGVQEGRYLASWDKLDDEEVLVIDVSEMLKDREEK